jgi:hypothetical protein
MTPQQITDRARNAKIAWDEFVGPAIEACRADYMAALTKVAANEPWESDKIVKLAIATRVIDMVESQMRALIQQGADAQKAIDRAAQIANLPARKRKWADKLGAMA